MPQYINPDEWIPADGFQLENNALTAVRSDKNFIVVAGPGAGKTELLAQRACYLLQTNLCKNPKKILAISFKRDAAFNLAERVEKRVGKQLSKRFTSLTFDAFSKGLVDRFRNGIPELYRPNAAYKIETNPLSPAILSLFEEFSPNFGTGHFRNARRHIKEPYIKSLYNQSYPIHSSEQLTINVLVAMLKRKNHEILTFPILSRLAQLLLNTNPNITAFLRQTYSHVFLDEFQDTTGLQFDLLKSAFLNGSNIMTAVGDTKQRIMLWAGAMDGIFTEYKTDFNATSLPLLMNFRSAPKLVKLQNHLTSTLMKSEIKCIPRPERNEDEGIAKFLVFKNFEQEAEVLANEIRAKIEDNKIAPREICLLYKQRPDIYADSLQTALSNLNINSRIENELQDLLVEPIIQFLVNFLLSSLSEKSFNARGFVINEYSKFNKTYDNKGFLILEKRINKKFKTFNKGALISKNWEEIQLLIQNEIEEITFPVFSSYYPQYNERTYFDACLNKFYRLLQLEYEQSNDLLKSTEKFIGKDCVPIMTIHKSKGLEFSIVYFIGFEDQNFWNYSNQPDEDTCAFFVALSRAKDEVHFTFSHKRVNNFGNSEHRSINQIDPLYNALSTSTIVEGKDYTKV